MFDSLINASMNDICLHTQTGSSSLHLCFISTLHTGAGQSASAVVDTMEPSAKRPRLDSPAGKAQETAAAQKTTAAPTQDPPPLDPKAYSTVSKAGAQSAIFDTTAACKHDEGNWKAAMKECAGWWKGEKNLLLFVALQTWKFCERCSQKLHEVADSFDFGWGEMGRASHQCPNNVKLQGNKPTVTVTEEDALKTAWEAAGKPGSVVGVLRCTKEFQCNKYMQQQRGDRNQDGDMLRRTDLQRFVYGAGNQEIGAKSCRVHMDMSILRDTEAAGYAFRTPRKVHTIASAALYKPPVFEGQYDNMEDKALMQSKLLVILAAADNMRINHLVLTAFGCGGRCKNPPRVVAEMMLNAIKTYPIPTIEICVLDDDGGSNFEAFKDVFDKATWD